MPHQHIAGREHRLLNPGTKLGHYAVVSQLGAGGMGEVYRARDEKLERDVALKLLPAETFRDAQARARLLQEARSAAALNHPHICTIHEVGESGGQAYIAMEFVEGRPLSERLQGGALPAGDVLRFGAQIADALSHAHDRRIIHRDLKAANVVISGGHAKVLDFGLAKRLRDDELEDVTRSQASLTKPGAVVGTLAYMAPEQLRGQPDDARSDIWSLGVMLYEMAAGARPFQAQTGFALSSAILNESPPPLSAKFPVALRAVIERCLQKDPARRYQRASEVRAALEAIQSGAISPFAGWRYMLSRTVPQVHGLPSWVQRLLLIVVVLIVANTVYVFTKQTISDAIDGLRSGWRASRRGAGPAIAPKFDSLAVLPLENLSGDPEQDYLAAGMHEALIIDLGKLSGLRRVSARPSVLRYQKTDKPLRQIAEELGVAALITGTVTRAGNKVRVTAQLLNPANDQQFWSESYEREVRDVLALQNEIVSAIARQVNLQLTPQEQAGLGKARQVNPEAYAAYLKGKFQLHKFTPDGWEKGLALLQEAVEKDPAEPLAYAGLAQGYGLVGSLAPAPPSDAIPKAKAAALKALELDESLAEAHAALAFIQFYKDWDFDAAGQSFRRAIELNPNLPEPRMYYGWYLLTIGKGSEAIPHNQRGVELDPLSPLFTAWLGGLHWTQKHYDEAILYANKALELQPDFPVGLYVLGLAYADTGRYDEAIAIYQKGFRLYPRNRFAWSLARVYAQAGRKDEARKILASLRTGQPRDVVDPWFIATAYIALGEKDEAIRWLEKAYAERHLFFPQIAKDPLFDPLRSDLRFQALRRYLNIPE